VLPAATGAKLGAFLKANVAAQSHLLTGGFAGYHDRDADFGEHLKHTPVVQDTGANAATSHGVFEVKAFYFSIVLSLCRLDPEREPVFAMRSR
jgi:hypothetical protein